MFKDMTVVCLYLFFTKEKTPPPFKGFFFFYIFEVLSTLVLIHMKNY